MNLAFAQWKISYKLGWYYRAGQSDIDTVIIVKNDALVNQEQLDKIADTYRHKYNVPKLPVGPAQYCWIPYEADNIVAKNLYESFGFLDNGEICENEPVTVLKL